MSFTWAGVIRSRKPDISESSLTTYISQLNGVARHMGVDPVPDNFFSLETTAVLKHLSKFVPSRRKNILSAILCVVDDARSAERYRAQMLRDIHATSLQLKKQKMSSSQRKNWISQDEILKVYNKLEREAKPLLDSDKLSKADTKKVLKYIALSCFVLIAPRRLKDYTDFKVSNVNKKRDNYMSGSEFVFNSYKTAKFYGEQRVQIPPKLKNIIEKWERISDNEYLLFSSKGTKLSPPQLVLLLNEVFGKKVSVGMLRHVYISDVVLKNVPPMEQLEQVAEDMGHSLPQQMEYKKFK